MQNNIENSNKNAKIRVGAGLAATRDYRGITLIALIITIIILLILAGVALNSVIGENGILKHAEVAEKKQINKQENYFENVTHVLGEDNLNIDEYGEKLRKRNLNNVSMNIKEGTLTKTGATIIITDKNEESYFYGDDLEIQKKVNNQWEIPELIDANYERGTKLWQVGKEGIKEIKLDWSQEYGKLKKGEYRLIKHAYEDAYIYTEFTIK